MSIYFILPKPIQQDRDATLRCIANLYVTYFTTRVNLQIAIQIDHG